MTKSPPRAKKAVVKIDPSAELLEPLKPQNLHVSLETAFLNNSA